MLGRQSLKVPSSKGPRFQDGRGKGGSSLGSWPNPSVEGDGENLNEWAGKKSKGGGKLKKIPLPVSSRPGAHAWRLGSRGKCGRRTSPYADRGSVGKASYDFQQFRQESEEGPSENGSGEGPEAIYKVCIGAGPLGKVHKKPKYIDKTISSKEKKTQD